MNKEGDFFPESLYVLMLCFAVDNTATEPVPLSKNEKRRSTLSALL